MGRPVMVAAALVLAIAVTQAEAAGRQIDVASADELSAALEEAKGGDSIRLAPGRYPGISLNKRVGGSAEDPVRIVSAKPSEPAMVNMLWIRDSEGFRFENLMFRYEFKAGDKESVKPFFIENATGIQFVNSVFQGDNAQGLDEKRNGTGFGIGLWVRGSTNILVEGCTFRTWLRGAVFSSTRELTVIGNVVTDIRSDGMDFAGVKDARIERNHFHSFRAAVGAGDHWDMVQFWTNGTPFPSENVVIKENLFDRAGGAKTQSIFMRNEEVDTGKKGPEFYYRNIRIVGNVIRNSHLHGITVGETDGLVIRHNTLLQYDASGGKGLNMPQINIKEASRNVTVSDNILARTSKTLMKRVDSWTIDNNVVLQRDSFVGRDHVIYSLVDPLEPGPASLAQLQRLPDAALPQGVGSPLSQFNDKPKEPLVLIRTRPTGGRLPGWSFEVAAAFGPKGPIDISKATITWDFGDGAEGSGQSAQHDYARPGIFRAQATLRWKDGRTLVGTRSVAVED